MINKLLEKRNLAQHGLETWNDNLEQKTIKLIENKEGETKTNWNDYTHVLKYNAEKGKYVIQSTKDQEYGTDTNTSTIITGGKTPYEAIRNAWQLHSIPPHQIVNNQYTIKQIIK